jgi:hypothetical protein
MEAFDVIVSPGVQVGTRELFRSVTAEEHHVVVASTRDAANALAARVLGEMTGQPNLHHGTIDRIHEWFHRFSLDGNGDKQDAIDALRWLPTRLGSIQLRGYVLSFSADELVAFWIEVEEAEKRRVLASERRDGAFVGLDEAFEFRSVDLAAAIMGLF